MSDPWGATGGVGEQTGADILIVDNDDRIVELVAWFLKKRGYDVRTAASFEEARLRIADGVPDLMLSDVDLGAENALDELPRLAREGLLPPTLIVSGYLDADTVRALEKNDEVLGTLSKPFDFTVLEERVLECLKGLRATRSSGGDAPQATPAPFDDPVCDPADGASIAQDDEGWIEILPYRPDPPAPESAADSPQVLLGAEHRPASIRESGRVPFRLH